MTEKPENDMTRRRESYIAIGDQRMNVQI